jgi:hypothetical protein
VCDLFSKCILKIDNNGDVLPHITWSYISPAAAPAATTILLLPPPPPLLLLLQLLLLLLIIIIKNLIIEIQCMWNIKTKVTPVIIGATGTISKSFRKYLSSVPGKHDIKELQKTAVLGTAHTLRKVLM